MGNAAKMHTAMSVLARAIAPAETIERAHRVDQAIDGTGRPILGRPQFIEPTDSDGSGRTWRVRVRNGALEINELAP